MTRYTKTLVAFVTALLATLPSGVAADIVNWDMTAADWLTVLVLVANVLGVYQLPNTAPAGQAHDRSISEVG